MSDDLVSRLRQDAEMLQDGPQRNLTKLWHSEVVKDAAKDCQEAATALTEARAEIERLREAAKGQLVIVQQAIAERKQAESDLSTLRARVREVVGPFGNLAQRYDDTVSDGWIPWTEFITDHEWPSEIDCRAARQLNEDLKDA